MILKSVLQKISAITVLSLALALVPLSTASANWNGQFTLSSATYSVGEGGGTVSITIRLSGSGTGNKPYVTYATSNGTATAGSDYTSTAGTRRFVKAGSWTFRIPITNDSFIEGNETFNITLSNPTHGATLGTPSTAVVTIVDNDNAGITVTPTSGLSVTEAGDTATFTVVLVSQPTSDVSIGLTSSDTTEGTVSPASLTFTMANWNIPQPVTITGIDDALDDGNVDFTIITADATSDDPNYNGINASDVTVTNIDNDAARITVIPTSGLSVTEIGSIATFSVVLNTQPTADVNIDLSSDDTSEGTVSPASLNFTSANWSTPQTVTITGVNDFMDDGDVSFNVVTDAATSTDLSYNEMDASDVSVTNIDNDTAKITVNPISGLIVTEAGGTGTFTVVLASQPTSDVSIGLSSSDTSEGMVSPASLIFTPANWNTPQTVTVTGVDDSDVDGDIDFTIYTALANSTDPKYNGMPVNDVTATNVDNDTARIIVIPTSGLSVTEAGGSATFIVVLASQPTYDVSIGFSSSNINEGTVSPASLTFTSSNWNTPQTVTVSGVDDSDFDGNVDFTIITPAATSSDSNYNGMNASDVVVTNIDDDEAGITVIPTSDLSVTEMGGTATFTVVLNTQPTDDVSINLSSSDTTEGTESPASLTFTVANWNTTQMVTVTGVDDYVDDGDSTFDIEATATTSADLDYDGLEINDVLVTNMDDDTAGITVTPTSGLSVTEAGGTTTFSVVLTSQPSDSVNIALTSSETAEGTVSPASLTFTADNWNNLHAVTVTGVDDYEIDGDVDFTIVTTAASSTDSNYNEMDASDVAVTNIDDDAANTPPAAVDDSYSTLWRNSLSLNAATGVLNNDSDADGDPLTAELVSGPAVEQGTLTFNVDGLFTFTPTDTFLGDATFTYKAFDGLDYSTTVMVTIHVIASYLFLPIILK